MRNETILTENLRNSTSFAKITENLTYHKTTFKLHGHCLEIMHFITVQAKILSSDKVSKDDQRRKINN